MTLQERLQQMVDPMPDEALVSLPAGWLREQLLEERGRPAPERVALSLEAIASRAKDEIFGGRKQPSPGAVRKWIRDGKDGVKLEAFGRPYVVTEEAWKAFVDALREQGKQPTPAPVVVEPGATAAEEIAAYKNRFLREGSRGKGEA